MAGSGDAIAYRIPEVSLEGPPMRVLKFFSTAAVCALATLPLWGQSYSTKKLDTVRRRSEWFFNQRAYPSGRIPPGARLDALGQLDTMLQAEAKTAATAGAATAAVLSTTWTQIGPRPTSSFWDPLSVGGSSGRVTALAVDPSNTRVVYLGAANG